MSKSFDQVVRNFTLYRVVSRFSFYVPIYVVALVAAGFSFLTIGLILFIYGISTMAFGSWAEQSLERRGASKTIARGEAAKEHLHNPPKQQTSSKPTLQTRSDARTHRISATKPLSMRFLAHFSAIPGHLGVLIPAAPLATDCDASSIRWIGQTG